MFIVGFVAMFAEVFVAVYCSVCSRYHFAHVVRVSCYNLLHVESRLLRCAHGNLCVRTCLCVNLCVCEHALARAF